MVDSVCGSDDNAFPSFTKNTKNEEKKKRAVNEFGAEVILFCYANEVDENRIWLKISWQKRKWQKMEMVNRVS